MKKQGYDYQKIYFLRYRVVFIIISLAGFVITPHFLKYFDANILNTKKEQLAITFYKKGYSLWKKKKYLEAIPILEKSFNQSKAGNYIHRKSAYYLAFAYFKGLGVSKNKDKVLYYAKIESLSQSQWHNFFIGMIYGDRSYKNYNLNKSRYYLKKSSKLGLKIAKNALEQLSSKLDQSP